MVVLVVYSAVAVACTAQSWQYSSMMKTLISSLAVISLLALVACSNDAASESSDSAVLTTAVNTSGVPETLTSVVETSEAPVTTLVIPLPQDLSRTFPSNEVLITESYQAAGDYITRSEQIIPADTPVFPWATGLTGGLERITDFNSEGPTITDVDGGRATSRPAVLVQRTLMFATPQDATRSMTAYQQRMGKAVSNSAVRDTGENVLVLRYRVSTEKLDELSETMSRKGSVIVWTIVQDSLGTNWTQMASNLGAAALADALAAYPSLAD